MCILVLNSTRVPGREHILKSPSASGLTTTFLTCNLVGYRIKSVDQPVPRAYAVLCRGGYNAQATWTPISREGFFLLRRIATSVGSVWFPRYRKHLSK